MIEQRHKSPYIVKIDKNNGGQRLDNFLSSHLKGVPKSHLYRIIRKGEVRINKKRCKPSSRLEPGDEVRIPPIRVSEPRIVRPSALFLASLEQAVIFEDQDLLVMNKANSWPVHGGSGSEFGVIEAFRVARPGAPFLELVHRLDKDTSGCLLIAKSRKALTRLQESLRLHDNEIKKHYIVLVKGRWKLGDKTITLNVENRHTGAGQRVGKVTDEGKHTVSQFNPIQIFSDLSLLKVKIKTGRMHQIRIHCAHLGHPIAGDRKYGDHEFNRQIKSQTGLSRLFLHALSLQFKHPINAETIQIEAPIPRALQVTLERLETRI